MSNTTYRDAVALIVGVAEYASPRVAPLRYAAADAHSLYKVLIDSRAGRFDPARVTHLTDRRATGSAIHQHLREWLPEQARHAELAIVYMACHGHERGFVLPHDADPADLATSAISTDQIREYLDAVQAQNVLVIFDCCHAGVALNVQKRADTRDMELQPSAVEGLARPNRFVWAPCDAGQKSYEAERLRHGVFTHFLLKGLKGHADRNRDGRVGVSELFEYVGGKVQAYAELQLGYRQTPWSSSQSAGECYVTRPAPLPTQTAEYRALEMAWETEGSQAVLDRPEVTACRDEWVLAALYLAQERKDPRSTPLLFASLAHTQHGVRKRALKALDAIGWDAALQGLLDAARIRSHRVDWPAVLDGVNAHVTTPAVLELLDGLVALLGESHRAQAREIHQRKRDAGQLARVQSAFEAKHSPYQLTGVRGANEFTITYDALHAMPGQSSRVLVRMLRPEYAGNPTVRELFLSRGVLACPCVHQNLAVTNTVVSWPDAQTHFVVHSHVEGDTLAERIRNLGSWGLSQRWEAVCTLLDALTAVHRHKLVHLGVKPTNILVERANRITLGPPILLLPPIDKDERHARHYRYAAPELFRAGEPDARADVYSVGCVAYELLSGRPPFAHNSPLELVVEHQRTVPVPLTPGDLPECWANFIARLLAKAADQRPISAEVALREARSLSLTRPGTPAYLTSQGGLTHATIDPSHTRPGLDVASVMVNPSKPVSVAGGSMELSGTLAPSAEVPLSQSVAALGSQPMTPRASVLAPRGYRLVRELGRGGMGVVYLARQLSLGRDVALKLLHRRHMSDNAVARFGAEGRALARLRHPNIVSIYDSGESDDWLFLSLEYVSGGTLAQVMAQGQPAAIMRVVRTMKRVAQGIGYIHAEDMTHRDLKPQNILMSADNVPKVTDFGLVKSTQWDEWAADAGDITAHGAILGTPAYMAPEAALGDLRAVGPAADVYALGLILYEWLTGRHPYRVNSIRDLIRQAIAGRFPLPRAIRADLPVSLEAIVLKCLAREPADRYPTGTELAEDLSRFIAGEPVQARPQGGWLRAARRIFGLR